MPNKTKTSQHPEGDPLELKEINRPEDIITFVEVIRKLRDESNTRNISASAVNKVILTFFDNLPESVRLEFICDAIDHVAGECPIHIPEPEALTVEEANNLEIEKQNKLKLIEMKVWSIKFFFVTFTIFLMGSIIAIGYFGTTDGRSADNMGDFFASIIDFAKVLFLGD